MEQTESLWLGILFAVIASTNMNVGKGVQKWKVEVFAQKMGMFKKEHIGDLGVWLIGMALTASCVPLFSFAMKFTDKTSLVSSLNGIGMIFLVVFAWVVLKEKVGIQELAGAFLVLAGTALVNYFDRPTPQEAFSVFRFASASGAMIVFFTGLAIYSWKTGRLYGFSFGALPGIFIGTGMILGDVALVESNNDMLGQLLTPYPYFAFLVAIGALVVTQIAFWRARAMVVVPTINSFVIVSPLVMEYFTFGTVLLPVQYAGVAAIVAGVIMLTYTDAQDRIEGVHEDLVEDAFHELESPD